MTTDRELAEAIEAVRLAAARFLAADENDRAVALADWVAIALDAAFVRGPVEFRS